MSVLEFLNKPNSKELVSGTADRVSLYKRFSSKYEDDFPGTITKLQRVAEEKKVASEQKNSFWESIADNKVGGFKFGFT